MVHALETFSAPFPTPLWKGLGQTRRCRALGDSEFSSKSKNKKTKTKQKGIGFKPFILPDRVDDHWYWNGTYVCKLEISLAHAQVMNLNCIRT